MNENIKDEILSEPPYKESVLYFESSIPKEKATPNSSPAFKIDKSVEAKVPQLNTPHPIRETSKPTGMKIMPLPAQKPIFNDHRIRGEKHRLKNDRRRKHFEDKESLEYITRRLKKYFRQQRRNNQGRDGKELSMSALRLLEKLIFPATVISNSLPRML